MKFNWGHGIAIFLIVFVIITISVVVNISTNDKYNHDLVVENYYEKELNFQTEIDDQNNASKLNSSITYTSSENGLLITFPKDFPADKITGTINMYRPSKKTLDFSVDIILDDKYQLLIPSDKLVRGRWNLHITWKVDKQEFMYKKQLFI